MFENSIVAGNSVGGASTAEPDCDGGIVAVYSLIGDNCPGLGSNTIVDVSGKLKALAKNGGPTRTHALKASSPAINAASPGAPGMDGACLPKDQRGESRPTGECDMGAFERQ